MWAVMGLEQNFILIVLEPKFWTVYLAHTHNQLTVIVHYLPPLTDYQSY